MTTKFNYRGYHYILHVTKNDTICDVLISEVATRNESGKPTSYNVHRDVQMFDKVVGNQTKIAANRMAAEIDVELMNKED